MKRFFAILATAAFAAFFLPAWAGVVSGPADHIGHGPIVNTALIAKPSTLGSIEVRIKAAAPNDLPGITMHGEFRSVCGFSHMAFDDPIVFPGQPGASHLHTFFGNTGTDAFSTVESILTTGASTCRGGVANRSAYWVPSLIDTRTGAAVKPRTFQPYYKVGFNGLAAETMTVMPPGLRMLAGNAKNDQPKGPFRWKCARITDKVPDDQRPGQAIPNCPVGYELVQEIFFPQCWNGELDSPDHKSHMAYPSAGTCPLTHRFAIPEITFNVFYTVTEPDEPMHWRLSSDMYAASLPAGYSSHGDWFNGWAADVINTWIVSCIRAKKNCHSHLLGDGRQVY